MNVFGRFVSHLRAQKIRCQLSDIGIGLSHFHGNQADFPLGWALLPLRRVGIEGNDNRSDLRGEGPRVLARDVVILEPCNALVYFLDDAEELEHCTPVSKWFTFADEQDLLQIPKAELRHMSRLAYSAYCDAVERNPDVFCPKLINKLERHAWSGDGLTGPSGLGPQ